MQLIAAKRSPLFLMLRIAGILMLIAAVVPGAYAGDATKRILPILLGLFFISMPLFAVRSTRQLYRKNALMQEWRTLTLDQDGLYFESSSSNSHLRWSVFVRLLEDKHNFVLMQQGSQLGVPIPKRSLSSLEIDQIRSLIMANVAMK